MQNKLLLITILIILAPTYTSAQNTVLFKDDECVLSYKIDALYLTLHIEDLHPTKKAQKAYGQDKLIGDFEDDYGFMQIMFDVDNDKKFSYGDWQLFAWNKRGYVGIQEKEGKVYSLYPGYRSLLYHLTNVGPDVETKTKVINHHYEDAGAAVWDLKIALKEAMLESSDTLRFLVVIHRNMGEEAKSQRLEPAGISKYWNFDNSYAIRISANRIKEFENLEKKKKKEEFMAAVREFSKDKFVTKMEYDGVYIDVGNKKLAELHPIQLQETEVAYIGGDRGYRQTHTYSIPNLNRSVLVPQINKIILKGNNFQGDFLKLLTIHKMENINSQNIIPSNNKSLKLKAFPHDVIMGAQFWANKINYPDEIYTPELNKTDYKYISIEYMTRTINSNLIEITLTDALERGVVYCLWSGKDFYMFILQ